MKEVLLIGGIAHNQLIRIKGGVSISVNPPAPIHCAPDEPIGKEFYPVEYRIESFTIRTGRTGGWITSYAIGTLGPLTSEQEAELPDLIRQANLTPTKERPAKM